MLKGDGAAGSGPPGEEAPVQGVSDSDWGQEKPFRKSITRTVLKLATGTISRRSKQKSGVAQSFKQAELVAPSFAVQNVLWVRKLGLMLQKVMEDSTLRELLDVSIAKDKKACILDARNPMLSEISKDVDLTYQSIIDNISKSHLKQHYVTSKSMVAELFTSNPGRATFAQ